MYYIQYYISHGLPFSIFPFPQLPEAGIDPTKIDEQWLGEAQGRSGAAAFAALGLGLVHHNGRTMKPWEKPE